MKKNLQILNLSLAFMLFASLNIFAQDFHFTQGFETSSTPDGWVAENVSYSSSTKNAANMVATDAVYAAKMKTDESYSSLQTPKINGATDLTFWCKVKDADIVPTVKIQTSTDGIEWTDFVTNPTGLDLENTSDFQNVTVSLNIEGDVYVRFYVSSETPGTSSKGTLTIDDIQIGKPAPAVNDVSLSSLTIDGVVIDNFDFTNTSYSVEIPYHGNYTVAAETNNPNATIEITQVSDIDGTEAERTASIVVTGEDGVSQATTTVVFVRSDYFFKEGFASDAVSLPGCVKSHTYQSANNVPAGNQNLYPGDEALKFTGGPETDPGYILTPKIKNVGTLTFWVAAQAVFEGQSLTVYVMNGNDSTEMISLDYNELTVDWQEVVVPINETTDSIQIKIRAICDINDESTSRIWIDDLLLTAYEKSTSVSDFDAPKVQVFPNPAIDKLNIQLPDDFYQSAEVFNMDGRMVLHEVINSDQLTLNISGLSKGIYVISLSGENKVYKAKFVKE
ncbi:T9SS type A sorting domain-containing protein [Geofilum sp. OHC36d9]|uniref:T9SS type A sorting domain-containing protein n=1 Tax=Geofilum sp. OHC36d9 TaxID=3458413 RepID=UPI0040336B2C